MRKMFVRFGKTLKDPETGCEIYIPKTMKVKHKYNVKEATPPEVT